MTTIIDQDLINKYCEELARQLEEQYYNEEEEEIDITETSVTYHNVTSVFRGSVDDVRKRLENTVEFGPGITILALQPGIGKSTLARQYCKRHPDLSIGIANPRHNLLDEFESELGFTHWYGLTHEKSLCSIVPKRHIKYLVDLGLRADVICPVMGCDKSKCPYHQQFKADRAIFPSEYLATRYIERFDVIFTDESILKYKIYNYNLPDLNNVSDRYLDFSNEYDYNDISGMILSKDEQLLDIYEAFTGLPVLDYLQMQQQREVKEAIKAKDWERIKELLQFDAEAVKKHLQFGIPSNVYYEPYVFRLFELASQGKRIVMMEATFSQELFEEKIREYYERYGAIDIPVKIYKSEVVNKNTKLYHLSDSAFSKSSHRRNHITKQLKEFIRSVNASVGIITYKENYIDWDFANMSYFGNTSGLNTFIDCDIFVVLGTYPIPPRDLVKEYNMFYNANLSEDEFDDYVKRQIENGKYPKFTDTKLQNIWVYKQVYAQYDAIHRSRGLIRDTIILLAGKLPKGLKREFTVIDVPGKEVGKLLDELLEKFGRDKGKDMFAQIIDGFREGKTNYEIAIEADIRLPGETKYDTNLVKQLRKHYEAKNKKI